jgi:hypothetical protein
MTPERDSGRADDVALDARERALVDEVARRYRPPEMTPARAAAFDAALMRRIEGRVVRRLVPVAAMAAFGAALVLVVATSWLARPAPRGVAEDWLTPLVEADVMEQAGAEATDDAETSDLPEDYVALAALVDLSAP